jgi:hypothetical protein
MQRTVSYAVAVLIGLVAPLTMAADLPAKEGKSKAEPATTKTATPAPSATTKTAAPAPSATTKTAAPAPSDTPKTPPAAAAPAPATTKVAAPAADVDKKGEAVKWAPTVTPKPLSDNVKGGLAWLVKNQLPSGAWTQGEESAEMQSRRRSSANAAPPSVADTAIAALSLFRAGNTPKQGEHSASVRKAVDFICSEIEKSKDDSLYITDVRNTRVQMKIGTYVDTFMACMLLSEIKGQMPDAKSNARVDAALDKLLAKIAKFQNADGSWENQGWAPVLSQAIAAKGINRAAQSGARVDEKTRKRVETYAQAQFDSKQGSFKATGSAGVSLYSSSASLGGMQASEDTNIEQEKQAHEVIAKSKDANSKKAAEEDLRRIAKNREDLTAAKGAIVAKMNDKQFVSGFGSNGGEEFLSYLNIGESLVTKGGPEWKQWDTSMTENLNRVQNQDGSWTGHHCITGRTFCTAAALLVLTVDRAPVPVSQQMRKH